MMIHLYFSLLRKTREWSWTRLPWPIPFPYWELLEDEPPPLRTTGKEKKMVMVHIPMVSFPYHPVKWGDGGKDNTTPFLKTKWQMPVEVEGREGWVWPLPRSPW